MGARNASVTVDISLLGDRALEKKLRRLDGVMQKKVVQGALRKAAKPILKRAKSNMPKGGTGALERSLRIKSLKRSRTRFGVKVEMGAKRKTKGGGQEDAFYGSFVELGTKLQKEQKILRNAKRDGASEWDRNMAKFIGDGIENLARKA